MPQALTGCRMLPRVSVPIANGSNPAATVVLEPDDDPPGWCSMFHGLRAVSRPWQVLARATECKLPASELAEHDCVSIPQTPDAGSITLRDVGGQDLRMARGWEADHVNNVFDSDGHTVQAAPPLSP
jgi:hypothetical protein